MHGVLEHLLAKLLQTGAIYAQATETDCAVHREHCACSNTHAACGDAHRKLGLQRLNKEVVHAATIANEELNARRGAYDPDAALCLAAAGPVFNPENYAGAHGVAVRLKY
jgi:hypothetical protein